MHPRIDPVPSPADPARAVGRALLRDRVRFDRHELAGAFGDLGTDLPLLLGVIAASGADAASVFAVFGALQVGTGLVYGLPMPVQPLKAMAVLVIAQKIPAATLAGGGVAIGALMLVLAASGLLGWLARVVPHAVVRGLQGGLGLSLAAVALRDFVPSAGRSGYVLAAAGFACVIALAGSRRVPAALVLVGLGAVWACASDVDLARVAAGLGFTLPTPRLPTGAEVWTGLWLLALPQLPLSLANSIVATDRTVRDLFPDRPAPGVRKIGLTYGVMNLVAPLCGGVPVCHGCGGLAGHHAFGARTGGSVVLYGLGYLILGLLFSGVADEAVRVFPRPILGVLLAVEALALLRLLRDVAPRPGPLALALAVACVAAFLPNGYVVGLVVGIALHPLAVRDRGLFGSGGVESSGPRH